MHVGHLQGLELLHEIHIDVLHAALAPCMDAADEGLRSLTCQSLRLALPD